MLGGSGGLDGLCIPRYLPEGAAAAASDSAALLPSFSSSSSSSSSSQCCPDNYGTSAVAASAPTAPGSASGGPFSPASEASPLTRSSSSSSSSSGISKTVLPAAFSRILHAVAGEVEKVTRACVVREKDLELGGGACNAFSFCSITIRKPLTPSKQLAIFYSLLPFVLCSFTLLVALSTLTALPLFLLGVQVSLTALSELVLKRVVPQPRPALSLVSSSGMPSSHCLVSFACLSWFVLEAWVSPTSLLLRFSFFCLSLLAFAPMPWARCHLEDHSEMQCLVGCLAGCLCGVFVFVFRRLAFPNAFFI
ncbi:hypothetical protein Efla_002169 [Eimeria flavescens]